MSAVQRQPFTEPTPTSILLRPNDVYMRQLNKLSWVQITTCRQFSTRPLFEPKLVWCRLDHFSETSNKKAILFKEDVLRYAICKMAVILYRPQCVNNMGVRFLSGRPWVYCVPRQMQCKLLHLYDHMSEAFRESMHSGSILLHASICYKLAIFQIHQSPNFRPELFLSTVVQNIPRMVA